jgi:hypothetical protein
MKRLERLLEEAARLCIPDTFPLHIQTSLAAYIKHRQRPDMFLLRALENDFYQAIGEASEQEMTCLKDLADWLYRRAPLTCRGSKEHVRTWLGEPS